MHVSYKDGHFPPAAFESMKQVELALKEKSGTDKKLFGTRLVDTLLGSGKSMKLTVPLENSSVASILND